MIPLYYSSTSTIFEKWENTKEKYEIALSNSVEDGRGFSEFGLSRVKVSAIVRSSKKREREASFFFHF
jgi:hypothetical protein